MCGRFTLTADNLASLVEALGAIATPEQLAEHRPRYNITPGDVCWLVRARAGQRELAVASWGLVNHWARDPSVGFKQINARAETLAERPAYREAYRARRCIVLADGFYEWRGPKSQREPLWFHPPDGGPIYLAGLFESFTPAGTDVRRRTFTIITTAPNALVGPVHDRMPAIVPPSEVGQWLEGDQPAVVLRPADEDALVVHPASPRLNRAEHDDADLLNPDDPRAARQLSLF